MDFDDLIMVTVNLFQALPEVAQEQRRVVEAEALQRVRHAPNNVAKNPVGGLPQKGTD